MKTSSSWALSVAISLVCCTNAVGQPTPLVAMDTSPRVAHECDNNDNALRSGQTTWHEADISSSLKETPGWRDWPDTPQWNADPMNLFVVIGGDGHRRVTLIDGDRFEPVHSLVMRSGLRGVPKFSRDGRYVYFSSHEGWITKYDLWNLKIAAEIRVGIETCDIALSSDGKWLLAANRMPHSLVLLDADLKLEKTYVATTLDGGPSSRVSAVYDARQRKSFIVAFNDIPEIWEISYNPAAEPIYDGLVHDYKMGEGIARPGYLGVRRTRLTEPLEELVFDQSHAYALGASRQRGDGSSIVQVVNLDVRRKIAEVLIPGKPNLSSGITFEHQGTQVLASPNLQTGTVNVIDMRMWKLIKNIETPGPGLFMRSHDATRYAWVDSMISPASKHTLTIIDKRTLKPAGSVHARPGETIGPVEFTKDGKYALASLGQNGGSLIVYDATTFQEVKRLPLPELVGQFNVFNRIR